MFLLGCGYYLYEKVTFGKLLAFSAEKFKPWLMLNHELDFVHTVAPLQPPLNTD